MRGGMMADVPKYVVWMEETHTFLKNLINLS